MKSDWLLPDWPAPAGVQALCTTRSGGTSAPPFDAMNLGAHVGDRAQAVAANRALLQQAIQARPLFLSQVHGTAAAYLAGAQAPKTDADASLTDQPGLACTVMVADCLPVLLTNRRGSAVAAAHAGWRGLAGRHGRGVLESVLASLELLSDPDPGQRGSELMAWLGPCIGPRAFEVGDDVREVFVTQDPEAKSMFSPLGGAKWLADLPGLARRRLRALGVTQIYGNDGGDDWCTVGNPARYFSHRRDRVSGRMAACIWIG